MGDRALVQFRSGADYSPVVYLHNHGSEVGDLLKRLYKRMGSRFDDLSYTTARFIGICHELTPGNLSIGVWNAPGLLDEDESHGDAGCFIVDCGTREITIMGGYGFDPTGEFQRPIQDIMLDERGVIITFKPAVEDVVVV